MLTKEWPKTHSPQASLKALLFSVKYFTAVTCIYGWAYVKIDVPVGSIQAALANEMTCTVGELCASN